MAPSKTTPSKTKDALSVKTNGKVKSTNKLQKKKKTFFIKTAVAQTQQIKSNGATGKQTVKTTAKLPTKPEEAGSNWKTLSTTLQPTTHAHAKYIAKKKEKQAKEELKIVQTAQNKEKADLEVWFDDVDPILLDTKPVEENKDNQKIADVGKISNELTNALALDCEMVGIGPDGSESALARVSIVNQFGDCVYDKFVAPGDEVTDYRTQYSGIRPHNLHNANELGVVCHEVSEILRGRLLIGHGLKHDLDCLLIKHPKSSIRDTSKYKVFREIVNGATPSLKKLAQQFLGIEIQSGEHSSIQDAQAAMRLYTMFHQQWETDLKSRRNERQSRILKGKKGNKVFDKSIKKPAVTDKE